MLSKASWHPLQQQQFLAQAPDDRCSGEPISNPLSGVRMYFLVESSSVGTGLESEPWEETAGPRGGRGMRLKGNGCPARITSD